MKAICQLKKKRQQSIRRKRKYQSLAQTLRSGNSLAQTKSIHSGTYIHYGPLGEQPDCLQMVGVYLWILSYFLGIFHKAKVSTKITSNQCKLSIKNISWRKLYQEQARESVIRLAIVRLFHC